MSFTYARADIVFELRQNNQSLDQINHSMICVTGTSTGIGKTVCTGLLAKFLKKNTTVITQKWVQSGDLNSPDINTHDALSNQKITKKWKKYRQVYSFQDPVSPHLAARLSGTNVDLEKLVKASKVLQDHFKKVIIETSGGIMVPINDSCTFGDLISGMGIPAIVVIPNQLGCINHALLTMAYMTHKKITIIGFIMNQWTRQQQLMHLDNPPMIAKLSGAKYLGDIWPIDQK